MMLYWVIGGIISLKAYVVLNLYVRSRILNSKYKDEQRRKLHLYFIWILPFLGPWMIVGFWKTPKVSKLNIHIKSKKRAYSNGNHASGGLAGEGGGDF